MSAGGSFPWEGLLEAPGRFLAASGPEGWRRARWVLLGVPLDVTTSHRPGTRLGPLAIRQASWGLETYSPELGDELPEGWVADLGDVALAPGSVEGALARIEEAAQGAMAEGQGLVALGGEHLATLPLVEVVAKRHPQLIVVQLDAHTDLRDTYLGERLSHATVLRRVAEQVGIERVWQYGVRSGTQEEFSFARHLYGELPTGGAPLPPADAPVYLTVDIDVADPAYAPGTGAPEPGGPTAREVLQAVRRLAVERQVVALDVMEVSPGWDPAGITASLAAKVVREVLIARRRAGEGGAHVG